MPQNSRLYEVHNGVSKYRTPESVCGGPKQRKNRPARAGRRTPASTLAGRVPRLLGHRTGLLIRCFDTALKLRHSSQGLTCRKRPDPSVCSGRGECMCFCGLVCYVRMRMLVETMREMHEFLNTERPRASAGTKAAKKSARSGFYKLTSIFAECRCKKRPDTRVTGNEAHELFMS